jgi:hypothetical protein
MWAEVEDVDGACPPDVLETADVTAVAGVAIWSVVSYKKKRLGIALQAFAQLRYSMTFEGTISHLNAPQREYQPL